MSSVNLARPGTLIRARGREWIVLPESTEELILARPMGGLDEETAGFLPSIEPVESSSFPLPASNDLGDYTSGRILRDAARLSTRAAAGPFRSFGRIATEPRPYQLVPLMMALRLDPVRLLIADDVGIGKTIEASLIARELLDRREIRRIAVLCPPQLAEQWQRELMQKFHIEAELVLSSTIQRLERDLPLGVSVFDRHRFTVVSTDFIKSSRRAEDFILKCPEFVIVDEAHGCTLADGVGRGRHQRFELLNRIAADESRHLLLVTATPHSGKEEAFRSLLSLLKPEFAHLPRDLERQELAGIRRRLAQYLVQRRRADIRNYLETDTAFPDRRDKEAIYSFSREHRDLFDSILSFAREYVTAEDGSQRKRRVRYWSALALMRCISSSPAAASATLRSRAAADEARDEEIDDVGRRTVLDQDDTDDVAVLDFSPGSDSQEGETASRRKLLEFARRVEAISAESDNKLQGAIREVKGLLKEGFLPIIFCRFVDTAEYVAKHLRDAVGPKVRVASVTGLLPPTEREARIDELVSESGQYVLVCTDCLAEGVNLQEHFNAVLHYDLAWNPTRHEQREGRVDRFGQRSPEVRVITYYGTDNPIDGVILDVLIRKHKRIKSDLGVTVAVPGSSEQITEALFEGVLFREKTGTRQEQLRLDFIDEMEKNRLHDEWDRARDREKASRSRFAQHTLNPDAVAAELRCVREAIGRSEDVAHFLQDVLRMAGVSFEQKDSNGIQVHVSLETPRALRQAMGMDEFFSGRFELPLGKGEIYLARTSPLIEGVAGWVLDQSLDQTINYVAEENWRIASRLGVVATSAVRERTAILIVRFRYHLEGSVTSRETILCEEVVPLACTGQPDAPDWLQSEEGERLLCAHPEKNLIPTAINQQIDLLLEDLPTLQSALGLVAEKRATDQLAAHERVRESVRRKGRIIVKPVLPADILGAYILIPLVN